MDSPDAQRVPAAALGSIPDGAGSHRSIHSCPFPESRPPGRALRQWRSGFPGYFDTGAASNGGTQAINGLIELHRRMACGFCNLGNYRLRMLLIGGGLPL
jgi:transposase